MKPHTQKFIQRRKFYVALPALIIPFMTMFFWALGGGKGVVSAKTPEMAGLNMTLPSARFDNKTNAWDKLSLYQKAQRDSLKASQAKKSDPYFRLTTLKVSQDTTKRDSAKTGSINTSLGEKTQPLDETEAKVYKKLSELQKQIDQPASGTRKKKTSHQKQSVSNPSIQNDVDRLENMMLMMQNDPSSDQEMEEINGVLNKILDIQHPERVKDRIQQTEALNDNSYATQIHDGNDAVGMLNNAAGALDVESNSFYGLNDAVTSAAETNAIKAEIYGNQNLVSGSVIKMELLQDINVNGIRIPKNHFVFGNCALNGARLTIKVSSIQYDNSIFPVSLVVYDIDGLEGIHVPGAIARDAAKKSSNQAVQDIQLNSLDPSLEVQAASAGIEAAKGMLSKKTRLIQVTVKAGYKVFLKDKSNSQTKE
jgi:conjugative transposon TraM protein